MHLLCQPFFRQNNLHTLSKNFFASRLQLFDYQKSKLFKRSSLLVNFLAKFKGVGFENLIKNL